MSLPITEPEHNGLVSGVNWDAGYRQVDLDEYDADYQDARARLRASVVVDVPQI